MMMAYTEVLGYVLVDGSRVRLDVNLIAAGVEATATDLVVEIRLVDTGTLRD